MTVIIKDENLIPAVSKALVDLIERHPEIITELHLMIDFIAGKIPWSEAVQAAQDTISRELPEVSHYDHATGEWAVLH